jgi:hypothetical protein
MTCSEIQEVLPDLLDVPAEERYPAEFQSHLRDCADCSELVTDLRSISGEARHLAANEEPSPLLWLRIAAQLRSEGVIRDQQSEFSGHERYRPLPSRNPWWKLSWLAPVAAVLVVAGTYVMRHQPTPVAQREAASPVAPNQNSTPIAAAQAPTSASSDATEAAAAKQASSPKVATGGNSQQQLAQNQTRTEESAPSSDDEQFLSVVSTHAPAMKVTYEKQLQAVNADIRETQAYVDQNPGDADARQHLMDAYQQKALLYQIGLDRIQ